MDVKVFGSSILHKDFSLKSLPQVSPPPSKSHSIRFLILATLAKTSSYIKNILESQDIDSCYICLKELGANFEKINNDNGTYDVKVFAPKGGIKNYVKQKDKIVLNVGNSGSLLYFLSMLVSQLPCTFYILGDSSIKKRPIAPIIEALNELGVAYNVPDIPNGIITIYGKTHETIIDITLEGKFSQVVSGLLLSTPFLHKGVNIKLKKKGEAPYLEMSLKHLKKRGIKIEVSKELNFYSLRGEQSTDGFIETCPNDWSSACFLALFSIASLSPIAINGLSLEDGQADKKLLYYLKKLLCPCTFKNGVLSILHKDYCMKGTNFNLSKTPDALPSLACIASLAKGITKLKGIEICRHKESDRVSAIANELKKLGIFIKEEENSLTIERNGKLKSGMHLNSYGDHRIALSLIAFCLSLPKDKHCIIENAECCSISYPNFIKDLKMCGARIERV